MKINICPICVIVSGTWLILSAGVAWGYFSAISSLVPIALLMGGTVAGIAYQGERKLDWASRHQLLWKILVVLFGMPLAYIFVTNLSKPIVIIELFLLLLISYFFFVKRSGQSSGSKTDKRVRDIEEKMEQCC